MFEDGQYTATEIKPGKPQIEWWNNRHWTMKGDVLKFTISVVQGNPDEPVFIVDGKNLSLKEFGELVSTYEGWGGRLVMVPEEEIHLAPKVSVLPEEEGYQGMPFIDSEGKSPIQ